MRKAHPIMNSLPIGKENAIDAEALCKMHNFTSIRQLQNHIAEERNNGAIILSTTKGGYYQSQDKKEIAEFIATLEKRAKNTMKVLKSARRYLKKVENQMTIEDFI